MFENCAFEENIKSDVSDNSDTMAMIKISGELLRVGGRLIDEVNEKAEVDILPVFENALPETTLGQ